MSPALALTLSIVAAVATFFLVPEVLPEEFYSWRLKLPLPIGVAVFFWTAQPWLKAHFAAHPIGTMLVEWIVILLAFIPMFAVRSEV